MVTGARRLPPSDHVAEAISALPSVGPGQQQAQDCLTRNSRLLLKSVSYRPWRLWKRFKANLLISPVAVRVRPPLDHSDPGFDLIPARFTGSTCHIPNGNTLTVESGAQGKKLFVFDRVFSEKENQEAIWDYVSDSVNSFVQGYNVSLLAYGQSGAGKSYTMGTASPGAQMNPQGTGMVVSAGPTDSGSWLTNCLIGIVPRAAAALFEKLGAGSPIPQANGVGSGLRQPKRYSTAPVADAASRNWQLKATYVEVRNATQCRGFIALTNIDL